MDDASAAIEVRLTDEARDLNELAQQRGGVDAVFIVCGRLSLHWRSPNRLPGCVRLGRRPGSFQGLEEHHGISHGSARLGGRRHGAGGAEEWIWVDVLLLHARSLRLLKSRLERKAFGWICGCGWWWRARRGTVQWRERPRREQLAGHERRCVVLEQRLVFCLVVVI